MGRRLVTDAERPLRVLYVIDSLEHGGAERSCVDLSSEMARRGHIVRVVTLYEPGQLADQLGSSVELRGLSKTKLRRMGVTRFRDAPKLAKEMRAFRPDVLHTFNHNGNRVGVLVGHRVGVPAIITNLDGVYDWVPRVVGMVERLCFRCAHRARAVSTAVAEFFASRWRFPASKLVVVPNAVRAAAFPFRDAERRAEVRAQLGLSPSQRAIAMVARFDGPKGHIHLLEAAARTAKADPTIDWYLVGDGHLRARVESAISKLDLVGRIHLMGYRSDIAQFLQGMDLFTMPSESEAFCLAVAEAMAAGVPVVGSDVGGLRDLIVDGETGWRVPPRDPVQLAAAWRNALSDPSAMLRCAAAARRHIEQRYDVGVIVTRILDLYRDVLRTNGYGSI
jgi:glycosyltransferase involved in cell wall biosynthesis